MLIEEKFTVKAPIQKVWDFLIDPQNLGLCVPGCEKMEVIDEKTYLCVVGAKVGPISAKFEFTTVLTEVDPPRHLKSVGRGKELDKKGTFRQESVVDLKEISPEEVEVSYRVDVTIVGKLATFGDRVMRAKAKEIGEEFAQSFNKRLSGEKVDVPAKLEVNILKILAAFLATFWEWIKGLGKRLISLLRGRAS